LLFVGFLRRDVGEPWYSSTNGLLDSHMDHGTRKPSELRHHNRRNTIVYSHSSSNTFSTPKWSKVFHLVENLTSCSCVLCGPWNAIHGLATFNARSVWPRILSILPHFSKLARLSFQLVPNDSYLVPHIRRVFESPDVSPNVCFDIPRRSCAT
jgi:hypothetical protein